MATNNEALSTADQNDKQNADSGEENANPKEQTSQTGQNTTKSSPDASSENKSGQSYVKNYPRVSKDSLYMIIALWMEDFVEEAPEGYNKVGAVLVLPNDVVLAADCSREGVHAVARLLMKHHDKAKGCKIFMSRKPCSLCAKLLVQSKVERVLFLPSKPEYYHSLESLKPNETCEEIIAYNNTQMKQVDMLFTASVIAQTKFVLQVDKSVAERKINDTPEEKRAAVGKKKTTLMDNYKDFKKNSDWLNSVSEELPWPAFDDNMKGQVQEYFEEVIDWLARVLVLKGLDCDFERCQLSKAPSTDGFNLVNDPTHKKQARHLMTIAYLLGERTDDPKKTGVGAVIASFKQPRPQRSTMEILALGWNGFPLKAHYGEFARASRSDTSTEDKKYPYIIHAEQNALLMRNNKNIEDAILFVTKCPCNECAPLIALQGVKTVVVDDKVKHAEKPKWNELGYDIFPKMVGDGTFVCYQTKRQPTDAKGIEASKEKRKDLRKI